jgi:hypothetical protein
MSETSDGGSRILRHEARDRDATVAPTDQAAADAVVALVSAHLGSVREVFHELVSEIVHVDVHVIAPTAAEPAWTLVTTGMSDLPMHVPDGVDAPRFAELMIRLPASWQVAKQVFDDERWYWPVRWLKILARLPHQYDTWLGVGHTIPNGDPPRPLAPATPWSGILIGPPASLPDDAQVATTDAGKRVQIYALYPLHDREMELKLAAGADRLFERLIAAEVDDVVDVKRRSVV